MERTLKPVDSDAILSPGACRVSEVKKKTGSQRTASRPPRTLWYMGVKARVLPGFLDRVLAAEVPRGGTVLDLMSGTGVVAAHCADRYRVFTNDAQEYSQVIARSLVEHDPEDKDTFLRSVDARSDLFRAYKKNLTALERIYAKPRRVEQSLLERFEKEGRDASWARDYRAFLETPGGYYCSDVPSNGHLLYAGAGKLLSEASIARYRANPRRWPACLMTSYYANIYFGLRQALEIDSLRVAIDELESGGPHLERKRVHYLSALLHAASVSTSGTSHFAQPRHLTKDTELRAMARRRKTDVFSLFEEFSREILLTVRRTRYAEGNRCFVGDYRELVEGSQERCRFRLPERLDLVYLDPPYTADHYSRFYHVLEVLARYDYPVLEKDSSGRVVRGRYPEIQQRFRSGFCRSRSVEGEFRQVIRAAAGSGAKLVVSYAWPNGLLLKQYAKNFPGTKPIRRFESLCRESYRKVVTERLPMMHSGQGDRNLATEELLLICSGPR